MDPCRFDALTQSLAAAKTRRGLLAGIGALLASARVASAQPPCPAGQIRNKKGDCNCPAGTDACPDGCYNRKSDPYNCGSCGNVCLSGEVCQKGECRCPAGVVCCPQGTTNCFGSCVDPASDSNNCGSCGNFCSGSQVCSGGSCQSTGTCVPLYQACDFSSVCCGFDGGGPCLAWSDCPIGTPFCC